MTAINGFSVVDYGNSALAPYKVPGTDVTLSLRKEIAPILLGYAAWHHANIEPLRKGECWGHAYRAVRGSTLPSFHSAGIAVDLNSVQHQLGATGTYSKSEAAAIRVKCRALGLRWGGDYKGRKDEMHVEIIEPKPQALAMVVKMQSHPEVPPPPVTRLPGVVSLSGAVASFQVAGKNWGDVAPIQRALAAKGLYTGPVDAIPGPDTRLAYTAWQNRLGYHGPVDADGMPGSLTLTALGKDAGFVVSG